MPTETKHRTLARAQGVLRPLEILIRMPVERRQLLAQLLGCRFDPAESAEQQAWRIINQNLVGLQARTHSLPEQLTPFSRNNNWWEILTKAARWCGLRFYPGMSDEEIERMLFEHCATSLVARSSLPGEALVTTVAETHPRFSTAVRALRLSVDGTCALLLALLRPLAGRDGDLREGLNRLTDRLRPRLGLWWVTSLSHGLRAVQQLLTYVFHSWTAWGPALLPRRNLARVCTAVALIHLQDRVDRTLDEMDLAGV
ncbi:MAG: hypothetical protein IT458_17230 [Planctomycetes bacterium]|nr:hypothetical protein [Planctomycetota bacterium]